MEARLVHAADDHLRVAKAALKEFVLHGARYAFPRSMGPQPAGSQRLMPPHRFPTI